MKQEGANWGCLLVLAWCVLGAIGMGWVYYQLYRLIF